MKYIIVLLFVIVLVGCGDNASIKDNSLYEPECQEACLEKSLTFNYLAEFNENIVCYCEKTITLDKE